MNNTFTFLITVLLLFAQTHLVAQDISKSFELRYVTDNIKANTRKAHKSDFNIKRPDEKLFLVRSF